MRCMSGPSTTTMKKRTSARTARRLPRAGEPASESQTETRRGAAGWPDAGSDPEAHVSACPRSGVTTYTARPHAEAFRRPNLLIVPRLLKVLKIAAARITCQLAQ